MVRCIRKQPAVAEKVNIVVKWAVHLSEKYSCRLRFGTVAKSLLKSYYYIKFMRSKLSAVQNWRILPQSFFRWSV